MIMTDPEEKEKPYEDCPALILCGGRSRRMGQDKAFLPLGSKTVLQRVETAFSTLSSQLVLVIGHDASMPPSTGFDGVVRDENPDFGPLEGLRVGLRHLERYEMVFVGTCDAPLVVPEVYRLLRQRLLDTADCDVTLPVVDGQSYPLTAVYRTSVIREIVQMIEGGDLRVKNLLNQVRCAEISGAEIRRVDPELDTVRNINTRDEYERMLQDIGQVDGKR